MSVTNFKALGTSFTPLSLLSSDSIKETLDSLSVDACNVLKFIVKSLINEDAADERGVCVIYDYISPQQFDSESIKQLIESGLVYRNPGCDSLVEYLGVNADVALEVVVKDPTYFGESALGDCERMLSLSTSIELDKITWVCEVCDHENTDHLFQTVEPLCGGCGHSFPWNDVPVNASTYHSAEETSVTFEELVLVDKDFVDSGADLTLNMTKTYPFNGIIPKDKLAAYFGSFDEYVPVVID